MYHQRCLLRIMLPLETHDVLQNLEENLGFGEKQNLKSSSRPFGVHGVGDTSTVLAWCAMSLGHQTNHPLLLHGEGHEESFKRPLAY